MKQLALHLPSSHASFRPEDFLVSDANRDAYHFVLHPENWTMTYALLSGPEGSGKTHLATLWAEQERAALIQAAALNDAVLQEWSRRPRPLAVDHITGAADETALFHLLNLSKETETPVLLISREEYLSEARLPDLKSRLLAAPKASVGQPDAELLRVLFMKHFSDRQLHLSPDILQYLVNHVDRSGKAVKETVRVLDEHALEKKQKISLSFVRNYLHSRPQKC